MSDRAPRSRRWLWVALALLLAAGAGALWFQALASGRLGRLEEVGRPAALPREPDTEFARAADQRDAARRITRSRQPKQILFGDLHVHTTFSMDAFLRSLPILQGEGAHPPADACDSARFCSALDFFALTDHAEGLLPEKWRETKELLRQCNAVGQGDGVPPDLVPFVGFEWTNIGARPEEHYGHKNVVFRGIEEDALPTRPIAALGNAFEGMRQTGGTNAVGALALLDLANRDRYADFAAYRRAVREVPRCAEGVPVRELPEDCVEATATPRELFAKLDDWGFDSLVIPHGNAWGANTPAGASWDAQLGTGQHDPDRQTLVEVYSGHGSSEEYRSFRSVLFDDDGTPRCPEPSANYRPSCWRAGEIIRERCLAAGESARECETRARQARTDYFSGASRQVERLSVPGARPQDWLDSGQCQDCFQPAFDYRPGGSTQYALSLRREGERFRFGLVGSSDNHTARAGHVGKETDPVGMTDLWGATASDRLSLLAPSGDASEPRSRRVDPEKILILPGGDTERTASFYVTGGLVAVHAESRERDAIWSALERREVYGTSGPRILLWFDLLNAPGADGATRVAPMGSEVEMRIRPRFRVRALGAFEQKPGCPEDSYRGLGTERVESLCQGECYHPRDVRHRIDRIEIVRIRVQRSADEEVATLVDDPWRVLPCDDDGSGCEVRFDDASFARGDRDVVYYARALQEPTPQINADGLRCERDDEGRCVRVLPCRAGSGAARDDDCLGFDRARAWSSPIFIDHSGRFGTSRAPLPAAAPSELETGAQQ